MAFDSAAYSKAIQDQIARQKGQPIAGAAPAAPVAPAQTFDQVIDAGIARGKQVGQDMLGGEARGREALNRSADVVDVLNRQKASTAGLNAEENRAAMDQGTATVNQATTGNLRALRGQMASNNVHGGAAVGAQAGVLAQGASNLADYQRKQILDNVAIKQQNLQNYSTAVNSAENNDYSHLKDQASTALGFADLAQQNFSLDKELAANKAKAEAEKQAAGSGSVICTALYAQGLLPADVYVADSKYGALCVSAQEMRGYHSFGVPMARLMKRSRLVTALVRPFGSAWAHHMAFKMGAYPRPNILGALIEAVGLPICRLIGGFIRG